jgi:catecholate siderophore receptor
LRAPHWLGAVAALGLTGAISPAFGAEAASAETREEAEVDTILVRGQRVPTNPNADPDAPYRIVTSNSGLFTEDLNNTPKSISVLSDALLSDMGVTSMRDVFRSQPGITLGTGEGGNAFGDRVFIRGFDARNDVYIDGVRDPGVGSREVFGVQQVEIMRGPSSTFGGRGTTGGAISLVSKQAGGPERTSLELTLGSEETRRFTLDTTRKLSNSLSARLNLMGHEGGTAGRDFVTASRWGAALSLVWQPSDTFKLSGDGYVLRSDYVPDWGLPWDPERAAPFGKRSNFYGVLARDEGKADTDVFTIKALWDIAPSLSLFSVLRAGESLNYYTASAPEQPNVAQDSVRANAKRRDANTRYLTHQSHATWRFNTGPISQTMVIGYEFARETTKNRQRSFTECAVLPCVGAAANPTLSLSNPNPFIAWGRETAVTSTPVIDVDTAAIYLINTTRFSPKWQLMAGVRADRYEAKTKGLSPNRTSKSDFANWHVGLVHKPIETVSLYVNYGSASNPPCEQLDALALDYGGCDARVTALDPTRNTSVEVGAKANLFGHLDVTAALFSIQREGVAIQIGSGATATIGTQNQEVSGAEITFAGNVSPKWSVFGGLTIFATNIKGSDDPAQNNLGFPNVSDVTFTLTSRHVLTERLHVGATFVSQSEKFGGVYTAGSTRLPGFNRLDLFGGLRLNDSMELRFNVQNATDTTYYDAIYRSATPFTYVAPGRSAQVTLDWHF